MRQPNQEDRTEESRWVRLRVCREPTGFLWTQGNQIGLVGECSGFSGGRPTDFLEMTSMEFMLVKFASTGDEAREGVSRGVAMESLL